MRWESHGREGPHGSCGPSLGPSRGPALRTPTLGADVLEDEVQVLAAEARRLHELLLGHAAQLQAADVEVAEGDAVGVQLVLVAAELQPFPDVALRPVLGVDGRPVGIAGCTGGKRDVREGAPGRTLGRSPKAAPVTLASSSLAHELKGTPALGWGGGVCWVPGHLLFRSKNQRGLDPMAGR